MKKSVLEDGDIVKTMDGRIYFLLKGVLHQINGDEWNWLKNYDSNLKTAFTSLDIVAISFLKGKKNTYLSKVLSDVESIVWDWEENPPLEEMTLEQVCKELGREIKLVPQNGKN